MVADCTIEWTLTIDGVAYDLPGVVSLDDLTGVITISSEDVALSGQIDSLVLTACSIASVQVARCVTFDAVVVTYTPPCASAIVTDPVLPDSGPFAISTAQSISFTTVPTSDLLAYCGAFTYELYSDADSFATALTGVYTFDTSDANAPLLQGTPTTTAYLGVKTYRVKATTGGVSVWSADFTITTYDCNDTGTNSIDAASYIFSDMSTTVLFAGTKVSPT